MSKCTHVFKWRWLGLFLAVIVSSITYKLWQYLELFNFCFRCRGGGYKDRPLVHIWLHLYVTISSLWRWNSRTRGRKQSNLMTQHHLWRELFLLFKEPETKKSWQSTRGPHLLKKTSPLPSTVYYLNHCLLTVCMCAFHVWGCQSMSSVSQRCSEVMPWKTQPGPFVTPAVITLITLPYALYGSDCSCKTLYINATLPFSS